MGSSTGLEVEENVEGSGESWPPEAGDLK